MCSGKSDQDKAKDAAASAEDKRKAGRGGRPRDHARADAATCVVPAWAGPTVAPTVTVVAVRAAVMAMMVRFMFDIFFVPF
jgi:hypothetical protein